MESSSRNQLVAILFCSTLLGLSSPLVFAQAPPLPPFQQCPHVGASNSCGVLIVINANNTVGIYTDSSIPQYENSDDTLTGIQNNSSQTIASLPLTSTTNIFGFDGDGICDSSITPQPAGCPFGSTGYEGPGVSFSNTSSDGTSGTVNFNPGIPPGGSAYFGLEEALTAAQITVPLNTTCPAGTATVGVSYSSQLVGTGGNGSYIWSVASGALAPLILSSTGLVRGTPTAAGTLSFTLSITDGTGASATQSCSIAVSSPQPGGGVPSLAVAPLLSKVVPGQTCSLTPPAASTSFLSTDAVIQIWFELSGVNNGDTGLISWTDPSGSVRPDLNISYPALTNISPGTNYVFCGYIAPDASMPSGQWTANVYWNNHTPALISLPFTFTNVSGGSGPTCSANTNCMVYGTANIFGSGHPSDPTPAPAGGGGGTVAPDFTFTAGAGQAITFTSVTGAVSPCSGCNPPVDGGSGGADISGYKGITGYKGAKQFPLVGVFLDNTEPAEPAPATLDFNAIGSAFTTLSPALRQVFYIGDGQTNGTPRQYVVPATATRMYLGFADAYAFTGDPGYYDDDTGSLTVIFGLGAASSSGGGACGPTANNLIGNGSFELPGGGTMFGVTGTTIPCWTITSGNVDYIASSFWQASSGSYSLDMDGDTPGTIVQSFATTSGTAYTVSFDLAGNPGGAQPKQLQVSAAGGSQNYSFNSGATSTTDMGWTRGQIFTFTANSSTTTLQFASLDASSSDMGPVLDNVCVSAGTTPCSSSSSGGGVSINLQTVLQQVNLQPGSYTSPTVLASAGLTIVANASGTPGAAGTGTLLVQAVGANEVHPSGTTTEAFFQGPGIAYDVLNCTTIAWTGSGSLTGFTIVRPGMINNASIPAWAMYAYDATGNQLDTKGEGNLSNGSFLEPASYASFTLSSATPIARVVFCSHNGLSTYNALPLSGGKATVGGTCGVPLTSNLTLCLDASKPSSLAADGSTWTDLSGQGHNATALSGQAPTPVPNAINGLTAAHFSGNQALSISGQVLNSQNFTVIAVVTDATGAGGNTSFREVFSNWNNNPTSVFLGDTGLSPTKVRFTDNIGGSAQGQTGQGSLTNPASAFVLSGIAGSDASIYQNSNLLYQLGSALPSLVLTNPYYIGRQGTLTGEYWNGYIGEVLVYDSALSASDLGAVVTYLTNKWLSGGGTGGGGGAPPTLTGSNCSPSVSPHDINDTSGNGISPPQNGLIFVGPNCQWSAYSPVSWATVTPNYPNTQSGNGAWAYALQPNNAPGATPRSTTLTVASVQVTVEQVAASAGSCSFSLDSSSNTSNNASPSPYTGGSGSFNVTVTGNSLCSFTVATPADPAKNWVQLSSSNFSGTGKFTVNYRGAQNNTTSARNLSLTVAGFAQSNPSFTAAYTIYQAAGPANTAPAPVITGISNAASYIPSSLGAGAIAQGSFFSIFGTNLGPPNPGVTAQSFPFAATLAGVSVTVTQGSRTVPAIPQFVAQFQINAIMPSNAPTGTVQVTVTFNGLSSAPSTTAVVVNNFGAFAVAGGRGPGIVQNFVLATRQTPLNTAGVTAAPGDTVILWGTGLGPLPNGAADNQPYPPPGQAVQSLPVSVQVSVGTVALRPSYSGRAPQFPGVDQINFVVPPNAPQGCYVPVQVVVGGTNYSNVVTMAIDTNRGTCSDTNPLGSLSRAGGKNGAISLLRINLTDAATPSNNGLADVGLAVFQQDSPAGALGFDLFSSLPPLNACTYYNNLNFLNGLLGGQVPSRGSTGLNAGSAITVIGPNGSRTLPYATASTPASPYLGLLGAGGGFSAYISSQPFLSPGSYTISGPGGTDVGPFSLGLNLTASIATNLSQISVIDRTQGLALNWTGGDPASQAVLILGASNDVFTNVSGGFACLVPLGSSSFTVPPGMMANLPVTAGTSPGEVQSSLIVLAVPLGNTLVKFNTSAPPSLDNGFALYLVGEMRNDVTFK